MITQAETAEIADYLRSITTPGVRLVCSFCQADLPGSDHQGKKVSHGACRPLCRAAKAMGWEDPPVAAPAPVAAPRGCDHKFVDSKVCLKCGWAPPPRVFIVKWRGQAVKFAAMAVRMVYSLVSPNDATRFASASSAMQTARAYGLRQGDVEIKPFQPTEPTEQPAN